MSKKAFGTYAVAKICNVTPSTVGNWIDRGLLPTFTTGGGHRRVWGKDLIDYLRKHNIPIPESILESVSFNILIVDDETEVRKLIKKALSKTYSNAEIYEAIDGFDAGQKVAMLVPKLVVLDIRLPGIDGLKVCQDIKADKRLDKTSILIVSGQDIETFKKEFQESGADDFLSKPFTIQVLLDKVKKLIGNKE